MIYGLDIMADDLKGRGGSIQAAINLEIANEKNTHLNIKIEGLNGQLPNLDLVNLVVKLCRREGIRPTLHKRVNIQSFHVRLHEINCLTNS